MECLVHDSRVRAVECVSIVRNISKTIARDRLVQSVPGVQDR